MEQKDPPVDTECTHSNIAAFADLLLDIRSGLRGLEDDSTDQETLRQGLENIPSETDLLIKEIGTCVEFCEDLLKKLQTETTRIEFLRTLEEDRSLTETTRQPLALSIETARESEEIIESLYKITSRRGEVGRVRDATVRRSMGQALASISVKLDRITQDHQRLGNFLQEIERRGLYEFLEADGRPLVEKKPRPKRKRATEDTAPKAPPAAPQDGTPASRREVLHHVVEPGARRTGPEQVGVPGGSHSPVERVEKHEVEARREKPKPAASVAVSGREFRKVRQFLNRLSRRDPFLPRRLGQLVGVLATARENAVRVRVEALWAERTRRYAIEPYGDRPVDESPRRALWSLPVSPPSGFREGEEKARCPGDEKVVPCPRCAGNQAGQKNKRGAKSGKHRCRACTGAGRVIRYQVIQTRYVPASFEELDYSGKLPRELVATGSVDTTHREALSAIAEGEVGDGLIGECTSRAAQWLSYEFIDEQLAPFFESSPEEEDGGSPPAPADMHDRRLLRARLAFTAVPVQRLECGFKNSNHPRAGSDLEVWVYGTDQRIHAGELPRSWTWTAAGLITLVSAVGGALGCGLARLVVG